MQLAQFNLCLNLLNLSLVLCFLGFLFRARQRSIAPSKPLNARERLRFVLSYLPGLRRLRPEIEQPPTADHRDNSREHPLSITLGRGLLRLADPCNEYNLLEQLSWLRKEIHRETGLILPGFKVTDNPRLNSNEYVVYYQDLELARGRLHLDEFLVTGGHGSLPELESGSSEDRHPVTGEVAIWLSADALGRSAALGGLLWFEPFELLNLHLRNTLRQRASLFVTGDYAAHFLFRALEMDGGGAPVESTRPLAERGDPRRRQLQANLPRFHRVLQSLLDLGGNLLDPVHILRTFELGLRRVEAPELVGKRILEHKAPANAVDNSVASAMLFSAHWNEMLCLELFPHMDQQQLSQLTSGILTMQHYPSPLVEKLWYDIGMRSESMVMGRSNQELAEQIRSVLSRGLERPQPLTGLEKLAVLLLSLPKTVGPGLSSDLVARLTRPQAGELATYLGRYAPFWSEAPMRTDQRSPLELGLRERVVAEFLDFAASKRTQGPRTSGAMLQAAVQLARSNPESVCSVIEQHYFPPIDPVTRFRYLVRRQPRRLLQWMLSYLKHNQGWVSAPIRVASVLDLFPPELAGSMRSRLHGRGCHLPEPVSGGAEGGVNEGPRCPARLAEFLHYLEGHGTISERASRQ